MHPFIHRIKFLFCKREELYFSLKSILGFPPRNLALYKEALSHKSLRIKDRSGHYLNNERLEYLGDAIIEAIVSDIVFRSFPHAHEGFLTTTRSKMVQRSTLNKLAATIGLDRLIQYIRYTDTHNSHINGNAFEALMGAIYLDQGYKRSYQFIESLIQKGIIKPEAMAKKEQNFKSLVLEWGQKWHMNVHFETTSTADGETPLFTTAIDIEGLVLGKGTGFSKKESHQKAAARTMDILRHQRHIMPALRRRQKIRLVVQDSLAYFPHFEELKKNTEEQPEDL